MLQCLMMINLRQLANRVTLNLISKLSCVVSAKERATGDPREHTPTCQPGEEGNRMVDSLFVISPRSLSTRATLCGCYSRCVNNENESEPGWLLSFFLSKRGRWHDPRHVRSRTRGYMVLMHFPGTPLFRQIRAAGTWPDSCHQNVAQPRDAWPLALL